MKKVLAAVLTVAILATAIVVPSGVVAEGSVSGEMVIEPGAWVFIQQDKATGEYTIVDANAAGYLTGDLAGDIIPTYVECLSREHLVIEGTVHGCDILVHWYQDEFNWNQDWTSVVITLHGTMQGPCADCQLDAEFSGTVSLNIEYFPNEPEGFDSWRFTYTDSDISYWGTCEPTPDLSGEIVIEAGTWIEFTENISTGEFAHVGGESNAYLTGDLAGLILTPESFEMVTSDHFVVEATGSGCNIQLDWYNDEFNWIEYWTSVVVTVHGTAEGPCSDCYLDIEFSGTMSFDVELLTDTPSEGYRTWRYISTDSDISYWGTCGVVAIIVTSDPSGASFSLSGAASYSGTTPWSVADAPAGTYEITWGSMPGYTEPGPEQKTLAPGGAISFYGDYNAPPVVEFTYSPGHPKAGEEVTFNASRSYDPDPDGAILCYEWDWDSDGDYDYYTGSPVAIFWWMEASEHHVRLRVTDDRGSMDTVEKSITIEESPAHRVTIVLAGIWHWVKTTLFEKHKRANEIDLWLREGQFEGQWQVKPGSQYLDWLGDEFDWVEWGDWIDILDKEIDPEAAPGLTYKTYALNIIHEERLVDEAFQEPIAAEGKLIKPLIKHALRSLADVATSLTAEGILLLTGSTCIWVGWATISLALKIHSVMNTFEEIDTGTYLAALGAYFRERSHWQAGDEELEEQQAWEHYASGAVASAISPWANQEEKEKILQETRWYFNELWEEYGEQELGRIGRGFGLHQWFKEKNRNDLRGLLRSAFEKYKPVDRGIATLVASPAELRVYDSQGRITGTIAGQVKEEIPNSVYDDEAETVKIFLPSDTYTYEVLGTEEGSYGLDITSVEDGEVTGFATREVPITSGILQNYYIETLPQNPVGATPSGWRVIGSFVDIVTTAMHSPITVGIRYDESIVTNEASLRLFHWNGAQWEDVTTWVDMANNMVHGQVTTLSPFFVGEPEGAEPTPTPTPPDEEAGGCFIATAAYGTSTAAELDTLRAFRDEVLLQNSLGSRFVALYYELSPPLADFISEHEVLRTIVRELLVDPAVWVVEATEAIWRN